MVDSTDESDSLRAARRAVQDSSVPAVLVDRDYRIIAANRLYRERYDPDIQLGVSQCFRVSHRYPGPCDRHGESCPLSRCLETGSATRVLHVHHCQSGPEHVDVAMEPVWDDAGAIVAFIERMETVTTASSRPGGVELLGESRSFNEVIGAVRRVAPSEVPVLLLGESGTGKELLAKAVHAESTRSAGPFIPVECSGLTESLFESELFGHEAGAFTGARGRRDGLVAAARGGTLFLDEVGDIPLPLQVKLLRLLESRTYRRVGSVEPMSADFRLVCATHGDLDAAVEAGRFRLDLLHRINAFPIRVPALRDRREDLPLLCARFLGGTGLRLGAAAERALGRMPFPGNVRELKNLLRRAALLCDGTVIEPHHLALPGTNQPASHAGIVTLEEAERDYLKWVVRHFEGDRAVLAGRLGVSERTLYRKLAALGD